MIREIADTWKRQYSNRGDWYSEAGRETGEKLAALNSEAATVDDVCDIIGSYTWTEIICGSCGKSVPAAVSLGDYSDYDSVHMLVCEGCLKAALNLFEPKVPENAISRFERDPF